MIQDTVPAPATVGPTGDRTATRRRDRWMAYFPFAAVLATAWVFRAVRGGRLPGDLGDARWTIGLHEHWYRVWSGQESIRDLHYCCPLPNTLGTSEAFLVQGQIWSWFYARVPGFADSTYEHQRGFTPVLSVTFVVTATILVRLMLRGRRQPAPVAVPDPSRTAPGRRSRPMRSRSRRTIRWFPGPLRRPLSAGSGCLRCA